MNVIIPEYRGYSLLNGMKPDVKLIQSDMINFIEHLVHQKVIDLKKTVFMSRSIGCLCSTYLSAIYKVRAMILYYPFYSIKGIIKSKVGGFLAGTIQENEDEEPLYFI